MLLTVEFNSKMEAVEIYCDQEGLEMIMYKLRYLQDKGGHVHFRTQSWAGDELTEEVQGDGNTLINHLVIAKGSGMNPTP